MRRKKLRHLLPEIADDDLMLLLADGDSEQCESPFAEFVVNDVARELWAEHGDAILQAWIRHSPGTRPWPWWAYQSPEPRRLLRGKGKPLWSGLAWGVPVSWEGGRPTFETQAVYLERHGLLLDGEGPPIHEPHPAPVSAPHWCVYR